MVTIPGGDKESIAGREGDMPLLLALAAILEECAARQVRRAGYFRGDTAGGVWRAG